MKRNGFIKLFIAIPLIGSLPEKIKEYSEKVKVLMGFGFKEKESLKLESQIKRMEKDLATFKNPPMKDISSILDKAIKSDIEMYKSLGIRFKE